MNLYDSEGVLLNSDTTLGDNDDLQLFVDTKTLEPTLNGAPVWEGSQYRDSTKTVTETPPKKVSCRIFSLLAVNRCH